MAVRYKSGAMIEIALGLVVLAILLMADTLVLGDGPQVHVNVPDLKQPLVLFRQKDTLGIRHNGKLCINGHVSGERLLLSDPHATVSGENISFAIEPVGTLVDELREGTAVHAPCEPVCREFRFVSLYSDRIAHHIGLKS